VNNRPMLTPGEVAQQLQVGERTIYEWLRAGELPGLKLGRLWRIRPADLEAYLRSKRNTSPSGEALSRQG
jgi:excisionase family DNA binding protein